MLEVSTCAARREQRYKCYTDAYTLGFYLVH